MELRKAYKAIEHTVSKNKGNHRPVLQAPYYNQENNELVSADGFRMSVCKITKTQEKFPDYKKIISSSNPAVQLTISIHDLYNVARALKPERYAVKNTIIIYTDSDKLVFRKDYPEITIKIQIQERKNIRDIGIEIFKINSLYLYDCATNLFKLSRNYTNPRIIEVMTCDLLFSEPNGNILFCIPDYIEIIAPVFLHTDEIEKLTRKQQ